MARKLLIPLLAGLLVAGNPIHAQMPLLSLAAGQTLRLPPPVSFRPAPRLEQHLLRPGSVPGLATAAEPRSVDDGRLRLPLRLARWPRVARRGRFGAPRSYGSHSGIDFAVPAGTPVYAARPGRVAAAHPFDLLEDFGRGYGGLVVVAHADGTRTLYSHLGRVDVKPGERVTRDRRLGLTGGADNGDSAGPHLHFMILSRRGLPVDPSRRLTR